MYSIEKFSLFNYPPEVIEMIFFHCENILALTLVCPSFNCIISNSPMLMKKLTVRWKAKKSCWRISTSYIGITVEPEDETYIDRMMHHRPHPGNTRKLLQSNRRYTSIFLDNASPEDWQQVVDIIGNYKQTVTVLKIASDYDKIRLNSWQYVEILSTLSENLRKLTVINAPEDIAFMGVLEFPNLEELSLAGKGTLLFQGCETPKLKKFSAGYISNFLGFIENQPELHDLEIEDASHVVEFFDAARLKPFSFKLIKFKIVGEHYKQTKFLELSHFLESQRQSLKVLSIKQVKLHYKELRHILTLHLEELACNIAVTSVRSLNLQSHSIKKLTFIYREQSSRMTNHGMAQVLEACPNVEILSLEGYEISKEMWKQITSSLTKLKNLHLTDSFFLFPLTQSGCFPSLETFSTDKKQALESFKAVNPQLKYSRMNTQNDEVCDKYKYDLTWQAQSASAIYFAVGYLSLAILAIVFVGFWLCAFVHLVATYKAPQINAAPTSTREYFITLLMLTFSIIVIIFKCFG